MTLSWDGWQSYLAADINDSATTVVLGFDTDLPSIPFDFVIGEERFTATAHPSTNHLTVIRHINNTPAQPHYGGPNCGVSEIRQQFIVTNRDGSVIDLTAIAATCVPEWTIPGGDAKCTITFTTYDPTRYLPGEDATLRIASNESGSWVNHWSGLLQILKETRIDDGGYQYELNFVGMVDTLSDIPYIDTIAPTPGYFDSGVGWWTAFMPIHLMIQDALRDIGGFFVAPFDWAHIVDGGQQIGKEYNAQLKTTLDLLNELCSQGDTGEALDYAVFTNADGSASLWLYRRSRWRGITIPWSSIVKLPSNVPLSWNAKDRKTEIAIRTAAGVAVAAGGVPGRRKVAVFDRTNTIQDFKTGYDLGTKVLAESSVMQTLTENPIVLEYKADDPATKYLVDDTSTELALWRGDLIAGRMATISDITETRVDWPITRMQVKTVAVDYVSHRTTCRLGKYVDWFTMANQYNFQDAKRPDSQTAIPGASSASVTPPAAAGPNGATTPTSPSFGGPGAGSTIGTHQVQNDLDIASPQWIYDQIDGTALPVGEYGDIRCPLAGHLLGFKFRGGDTTRSATDGTFEIYKGHGAGSPTLISTITVSAAILAEDIFAATAAIEVTPGDYLRLLIPTNDPITGFAHITIDAIFRRTGGSDRPVSTAAAGGPAVTTSRDADTGVVTFHITADRPCRAYVAFDVQPGPYRNVTGTTSNLSLTPEPATFSIPTGVTMHGQVHLFTADNVESIGPDFVF